MKNLSVIAMVLVPLIFCSCKKSEKEEVSKAADNATQAARIAVTNWLATNTVNLETNQKVLAGIEKFPDIVQMAVTNEVTLETGRAGKFLTQLREQGRLPGVSKDEHGEVTSEIVPTIVSNNAVVITYPVLRTFDLVKEEEIFTNHYTLVRLSKDSDWKLQKAWRTDTEGNVIQEWPVK